MDASLFPGLTLHLIAKLILFIFLFFMQKQKLILCKLIPVCKVNTLLVIFMYSLQFMVGKKVQTGD